MKVSVVVPVYGSAGSVGELHARLSAALRAAGDSYEPLFVDDGCPEG